MSTNPIMTTKEAAAYLGVTTARVGQFIKAGTLPATRHGRDWQIDRASLEAFAARPRPQGRPRKKPATDEQ